MWVILFKRIYLLLIGLSFFRLKNFSCLGQRSNGINSLVVEDSRAESTHGTKDEVLWAGRSYTLVSPVHSWCPDMITNSVPLL